MQTQDCGEKILILRLAFWFCLACFGAFLVFTACFLAIAALQPAFTWTDIAAFTAFARQHNQIYKHLAEFAMLIFACAYAALPISLACLAGGRGRVWLRLAGLFGAAFMVCSGGNYFVQLSAVRLQLAAGQGADLAQWLQSNPLSGMAALNMLGWTVFFGVSSLCLGAAFAGGGLPRAIRWVFLANGGICLLGAVGYILQIMPLLWFCMNFGMGGAVLLGTGLLSRYCRRIKKAAIAATYGSEAVL